MSKLKVFVWDEVYRDWNSGLAVAIAHDSDEARKLIVEQRGYADTGLVEAPKVFDLDECEPVAFSVVGGS